MDKDESILDPTVKHIEIKRKRKYMEISKIFMELDPTVKDIEIKMFKMNK